ncbi:MAG: right-handed parallel beta-helix repeat-containing protein [Candidatus Eisenbacteria sp.]|nr:right-handed parallel beta-helix repeat-containing protein [Candidatus Eisenbacteria bacterium]
MLRYLLILSAFAAVTCATQADTFLVLPDGSGDFPTIQAAVDAASDGDVVELSNGTFRGSGNRNVVCDRKAITIRSSSDDPEHCSIDCEADCSTYRRGFSIQCPASGEVLLRAITVMNGCSEFGGGAVCCGGGARVRFVRCVFRDNRDTNHAEGEGGGAVLCGCGDTTFEDCLFDHNEAICGGALTGIGSTNLTVDRCVFRANTAADRGGACHLSMGSAAHFSDCLFFGNIATAGGAIWAIWEASAILDHCTLANNTATAAGNGLVLFLDSHAEISHSLFAFNHGPHAIACETGLTVSIVCTNIFDNEGGDWTGCVEGAEGIDGNISFDPLFCGSSVEDYALHADSPCAAGNNPECGRIGALGVDCAGSPVDDFTWGRLKALFRQESS